MPSTCIIRGCKTKYATDVSFHKFPVKNIKLLGQWIKFANRGENWKPTRWTSICSSHFQQTDFQVRTSLRKTLKKFAVPSLNEASVDDLYQANNDSCGEIGTHEYTDTMPSPRSPVLYNTYIDPMCHFCGEKSNIFNFSKLNLTHFNAILKMYPSYLNLNEYSDILIKICDKCYNIIASFELFLTNFLKLHSCGDDMEHPVESPELGDDTYLDTSKLQKVKIKQEPITVIKEEILEPGQRFIPSELLTGQSLSNNDVIEVTPPNDVINIIEEDNIANTNEIQEEFDIELKSEEVKLEIIDTSEVRDLENARHDHTYIKYTVDNRYDKYEYIDDQKPIFFDQNTCTLCNSYFEDQQQLEKHTSIFHTFHSQTCNECYQEFKTLYDYLIHKNDTHGKLKSTDDGFDEPTVVFDTTPTKESNEQKFICDLCTEVLVTKTSLNHHKKYLCKFKLQYCKVCKIGFDDMEVFRSHICHKKTMLRSGGNLIRNKTAKLNIIKNGRYTCKFCSRTYGKYYNLLKHVRLHRPIQEWNLKCGNCGMLFDRIYDLNQHCRRSLCTINPNEPLITKLNFNTSGIKRQKLKYVCLKCNKILSSSKSLKLHEYIHSTTRPFVCETCGKKFRSPINLRQHKKSHVDQKAFACNYCEKKFKWKSNLRLHVNSFHLDIKPYVCSHCNYRYARRREMLRCKHSIQLCNKS